MPERKIELNFQNGLLHGLQYKEDNHLKRLKEIGDALTSFASGVMLNILLLLMILFMLQKLL